MSKNEVFAKIRNAENVDVVAQPGGLVSGTDIVLSNVAITKFNYTDGKADIVKKIQVSGFGKNPQEAELDGLNKAVEMLGL